MPKPSLSFVWNNRGLGPIVLPCPPSRKANPLGQGLREGIYGQGRGFMGRDGQGWQGPSSPVGAAWPRMGTATHGQLCR